MKDLTEYLCSPINTSEVSNSMVSENKKEAKANENEIKTQTKGDLKNVQNGKKRKKKKIKHRPSDPAVKNVIELLSNSLCIISPNSTFSDQSELQNQNSEHGEKNEIKNFEGMVSTAQLNETLTFEDNESNSCILLKDEQSCTSSYKTDKKENEHSKSANKLNAFQFMMESRNKSIGLNSPGKDQPEDETKTDDGKEIKDLLSARKSLFQNWADKKGASKRKREEEEKDDMINYKLQKRARRMKRLLKVEEPKYVENNIRKKRKKGIRKISTSSSENSTDSVLLRQEPNTSLTNSVLEVIEENAQDHILRESKTKEVKQGLLNFFGVVNKTKSETVNKQEQSVKQKDAIKTNVNTAKSKKKKLKSNLDREKINKSSKHIIIEESSSEEQIANKQLQSKKQKNIIEETSQESVFKNLVPKTPKNRIKDDESNFTPRSLKSWKMKIKFCDEGVRDEVNTAQNRPKRSTRISNYKLLFSEESSNEGEISILQRKRRTNSKRSEEIVCLDDDSNKAEEPLKPIKVAPVFAKATPKPKLAPEVVEARKQFLMSGIPDSLKKNIEKQQSVQEREYDIFPSISHIQQRCETERFWNLPDPQLDLKVRSPLKIEEPVMSASLTNSRVISTINIQKEVKKVDKLKTLLNKIKSDNPNYPVYKSFRLIYEKSGKSFGKKKEVVTKHKKGKKRRSKNLDKSIEIIEEVKPDIDSTQHAMWTEKYKPMCSDDIIGNIEAVKNLKKWLAFWKNFSKEINTRKKKREEYCNDFEFDTTDCDSRDSTKTPDNTVVVGGPYGSGKSTAIYAICHELGFNVIELNASSKRTGKRLLQELQEATQSHQVRKKQHTQVFIKLEEEKEQTDKKMCVLLIEDVDLVFDQDDGFVSALTQLVSTSKRPIVLTTTDTSSVFVQKFVSQYHYISFLPLSSQSLATWLQIVCLVEGLLVNQGDIGSLLEFNKGDVRKTLLQLQFWVQSGGQIVREDLLVKTKAEIVATKQKLSDDEQEPCLEEENKEIREIFVHSDCIRSFEIFKHHKSYRVPYYIDLGLLWWNIPNILGIKNFSEDRIKRFKENHFETIKPDEKAVIPPQSEKLSPVEKRKLGSLSKLNDSLAFTDFSLRTVNYCLNLEPDLKNYSNMVKDSLELGEPMDSYVNHKDFVHETTHTLVNGYIEEFSNIEECESVLNIAVPEKTERRWRAKMHVCEDVFLEALPLSTYTERRSVALDYMPFLRNMSRSESRRAANNTKRGNRFRNYLRSLGVNYNDNTLKLACNILTTDF